MILSLNNPTMTTDEIHLAKANAPVGATHLLIVSDGFCYELYPVYAAGSQDLEKKQDKYHGKNMQSVMEVIPLPSMMDEMVSQEEKDWEGSTERDLKELTAVVANISLPNSVRHAAAKELLKTEGFTVKNYPEKWTRYMGELKEALHSAGWELFVLTLKHGGVLTSPSGGKFGGQIRFDAIGDMLPQEKIEQ